ncbi:UvrB/UvrC motif-containing protein [Candidatus Clavichlamydia salmonicola]|uniref:UvrB/UvrC motif-containing protein n=1 Tax=Candidatus Clavichlamydia salmonicola TaxID=469812 RepID=UPI001890F103|nr:UvrB/UvrC motif-containing protein [Candidatus Clavichlamydia salmonicola]
MKKKPKECVHCKKPITICFSEVSQETLTHTFMCESCPQLSSLLYKQASSEKSLSSIPSLECDHCHTTWKEVLETNDLGCSHCYDVFKTLLVNLLIEKHALSEKENDTQATLPLHVGKEAKKALEINPQLQIIALTEALNETLAKENYEEAAVLRDQIRKLTNTESHDKSK